MTRYLEIKPGSISEVAKKLREDYEAYFKKELEKAGKTIPQMTDAEKKAFFNRVDKGYNAKNEQDNIKKAPYGHQLRSGELLLEPQNIKKEATSSIIGQDLEKKVEDEAVDKDHMLVVNPKNKKPGVDGVKKIHKKDWPEHQKQGYIQAEEIKNHQEPDADNMGGPSDHDADNKKKLSKSEKNEAAKEPYAIGMAAAMKATGDKPPLKKSTIIKAHDIAKKIEKNEELTAAQKKLPPALQKAIEKKEKNEETIKEAGMKAIDTDKAEMQRLHTRLTQLRDAEKSSAGGDTTNLEKQINQTRLSLLDLQKKNLERKQKKEDTQSDKQNASQKEKSGEKEIINKLKEGKMNYKSYKKALKKEEDEPKKGSKGKTMTDKPMTPIDVEPKISHN